MRPDELLPLPAQRIEVVGVAFCGEADDSVLSVATIAIPAVGDGAFAVEIRGDSMGPAITSGDLAIAVVGDPAEGDLAVVELIDGRRLMKQWRARAKVDGSIKISSADGEQTIPAAEVAPTAVVHIVVKRVHRRRP